MSADRNADLAKIHIAKKQLNIDDDQYRDILWSLCRVRSSADITTSEGRDKVLEHLRACGFKASKPTRQHKAEPEPDPDAPHNLASSKQLQYIGGLLRRHGRKWNYAQSMAKSMFKRDRITFCTPAELSKIIAALNIDGRRREKRKSNARQ